LSDLSTKKVVLGKRGQPVKVPKNMRLDQERIEQGKQLAESRGITFPALIEDLIKNEFEANPPKRTRTKSKS